MAASGLIERDREIAALEHALADARAGTGATVFIEGPAGVGKSSLLALAAELATRADIRTVAASGRILEREFPFGLAIQLFEPLWLTCGSDERASLLAGAAQLASPLLNRVASPAAAEIPGEPYAVIHGLFRVAQNLISSLPGSASAGLAIIVDDAHLADALSLRFLAYLAERSEGLPIAVIAAVRVGEPCAEPRALAMLRRAADKPVLRPSSLSEDGVAELVRRRFPEVEGSVCVTCEELTAGNPFLLERILEALDGGEGAPSHAAVQRLAREIPATIREATSGRLEDLAAEPRAVAKAVAAFQGGASVLQISQLTGLEADVVARAADELATMEVLRPSAPLGFAHPLMRAAVRASLTPFERAHADRRAAQILAQERESADRVAAHLLDAALDNDLEAIEALREAARSAMSSGSAQRAVQLLERALAEGPRSHVEVELLTELGAAEAQAGLGSAEERLSTARRIGARLRRRAELALEKGQDLYTSGRYREAAAVLDVALSELGTSDEQLAQQLLGMYVSAAALVEDLQRQALERRAEMLRGLTGTPAPHQRVAVAHTAVHDALRGASRAEVRLLVDLAWGNGALLHGESADAVTWPLLLAALVFTEELERTLEVCDTVLAGARRQQSALMSATIDACRSAALLGQGRIAEAEEAANSAMKAPLDDGSAYLPIALSVIACCHMERGRMEQADTVLAMLERQALRESIRHPMLLELRARLRLAQHRPREALEDALHAGRLIRASFPKASPGAIPWRSTAGFAHLALGEPWNARKLADEELHDARRIGLTSAAIRNLRLLGLAAGGDAGIELLTQAVSMGESHPARLEHNRALVDLGAALRRANRRVDARGPLRQGLELSHKVGAEILAGRAHVELVATGARPRRAVFSGLDALTPSQRRVAGLAAQGLTTRQIAETLFVTPKTVEFHLRHIYQKLDVSSREELSAVLEAA